MSMSDCERRRLKSVDNRTSSPPKISPLHIQSCLRVCEGVCGVSPGGSSSIISSLTLCEALCYELIEFVVFTAASGPPVPDMDVYSDGQERVPSY